MTDLWNLWEVKPPPVCSVKTHLNYKGISDLNEVTYDALKTLKDIIHLDKEAAVLSRFLYKHKRTFRHDKGMQNLVKVNQCLKKYLKLDMSGIIFTFKQALPNNKKQGTIAYLPTKQMLKWILLRLQAFAQLFVRVTELAKETAVYIYRKMCLGWALNHSLLIFSIIARILTSSKYLVAKSIEWYTAFYKSLPYLEETADFLPDYEFPTDLRSWLGGIVDVVPLKKKTFADEIFELIDLANADDDEEKEQGGCDSDSEVKIVKEKFIKSIFKMDTADVSIDSDIEEVPVEERKKGKGVKRPKQILLNEDMGVPVGDDDNDDDADDDEDTKVRERPWKKQKKRNERKRTKWLKKVKKTFKKFDDPESSIPKREFNINSDVSYLTID